MIAGAVIAVEMKDLLSSVIAVGLVGIGLSMSFLLLKAPDLAIMQLVVEILSLIILIRATIKKDLPFSISGRWFFNTSSTIAFLAVFLACGYLSIKALPLFGRAPMRMAKIYLDTGSMRTDARNVVSAITLHYRALDTLAEVAVIFAAIVGALAITRKIVFDKEKQ
jgi:multisubunit Na+/H+ antiporter MnhB subunit